MEPKYKLEGNKLTIEFDLDSHEISNIDEGLSITEVVGLLEGAKYSLLKARSP